MKPAPIPYSAMVPQYHNGYCARAGDRVVDRDGAKGTVIRVNEDNEAFVAWDRFSNPTVIHVSDLDLAS